MTQNNELNGLYSSMKSVVKIKNSVELSVLSGEKLITHNS